MRRGMKPLIGGLVMMMLAAVIFAAGLALSLWSILGVESVARFTVPGVQDFSIDEPGRYYIWHEHSTTFNDKAYRHSSDLPHGFELELFHIESGETVPLSTGTAKMTRSGSQGTSVALAHFEVEAPGSFMIQVTGPPGEERVFSVSRAFMARFLVLLIGGNLIGGLLGLAGFVLLVVGIVLLVTTKSDPVRKPEPSW